MTFVLAQQDICFFQLHQLLVFTGIPGSVHVKRLSVQFNFCSATRKEGFPQKNFP